MSLVNKMLRDLDARRVGDGERAALPAAVTPLAAHQEPRPICTHAAISRIRKAQNIPQIPRAAAQKGPNSAAHRLNVAGTFPVEP